MSWRLANSLIEFEKEIRTQRPGTTLGDIRDPNGGSESDHNPWVHDSNGEGVVRAVDTMVYGATGAGNALAHNLAAKLNKHPAMGDGAYVIWQQHIISADRLSEGWRLMEDRGSPTANHMDHVHLSVCLAQGGYDYKGKWGALFSGSGSGAAPTPGNPPPVTSNTPAGDNVPVSATAAHQAGAGSGSGSGDPGTLQYGMGARSTDGGGLSLDNIDQLVVYAGALILGVALIGLGAIRTAKPTGDRLDQDVQGAATAVIPEARAAGAVAGATQGARA